MVASLTASLPAWSSRNVQPPSPGGLSISPSTGATSPPNAGGAAPEGSSAADASSAAPRLRQDAQPGAPQQQQQQAKLPQAKQHAAASPPPPHQQQPPPKLPAPAPPDAGKPPPRQPQPIALAAVGGPPTAAVSTAATAAAAAGGALAAAEGLGEVVTGLLMQQLTHFKLLFAGAMSAVVSRTAMAPLERVKMDQVLRAAPRGASTLEAAARIWRGEGLIGFWRGNGLNVMRTAPFKALNFASFDVYSQAFASLAGAESNAARFAAGACAGITATLVCFPLDVLRTRMMAPGAHKYGGAMATLAGIMRYEGLPALYAGCVPAVLGMAPAGAIFYGTYDMLKSAHLKHHEAALAAAAAEGQPAAPAPTHAPDHLPSQYTLLYGAMAGACAELVVYPLEVVRRRMQLHSMAVAAAAAAAASGGAPSGAAGAAAAAAAAQRRAAAGRIMAACASVLKADGVRGFYAGMAPNMLQVLPSAALSYFTYETVKGMLGAAQQTPAGTAGDVDGVGDAGGGAARK